MTIFKATAKAPISYLIAFILFASGGLALAAPAQPPAAASTQGAGASATANLPGTVLDQVVAVANSQPILQSSLDNQLAQVRSRLQAQGTPLPPARDLRHQVLEHLITQSLELQAAKNQGIQVSDDDVNRALSSIAARNNLTLAQLPQALAAQGLSYSSFRQTIHDQMVIRQLEQQAVASNISITPAEIKNYLNDQSKNQSAHIRYHLAQILIPFPSNPTPKQAKATLNQAKEIRARLEKGANFAAMAAAKSAGPQALKGGDLGWMTGADLPTLFSKVVPSLKVGGLSAPIAGAGGYHIVKLIARKQATGPKATEYHVKHILLKTNPVRNSAQSKALAEKLRKEIIAGKISFDAAAKQYSDDPNSAGNNGDLGWQMPDDLPPPLAQVLPKLKPGTISQPIRTQYGWHLIEVVGTRKRNENEEKLKHEAYQALFQRKMSEQLAQFKRSIRDQAYIHILVPADRGSNNGSQ